MQDNFLSCSKLKERTTDSFGFSVAGGLNFYVHDMQCRLLAGKIPPRGNEAFTDCLISAALSPVSHGGHLKEVAVH